MNPEELRTLMAFLQGRVELREPGGREIRYDPPSASELSAAGMPEEGIRQLLDAPWYNEMIEEVEQTAEFCDPDDPPETVLAFARDVVTEYLRKRFQL